MVMGPRDLSRVGLPRVSHKNLKNINLHVKCFHTLILIMDIDSEDPQQLNTIILSPQHYYRYVFPSSQQKGLKSFYGEDRSFCIGQIFDASDFIIEFQFNKNPQLWSIPHHHNSFRGSLRKEEIQITGLYYLNQPIDFDCDQFVDHLKYIFSQLPPKTFLYEVDSYPDAQSAEIKQIRQKIGSQGILFNLKI